MQRYFYSLAGLASFVGLRFPKVVGILGLRSQGERRIEVQHGWVAGDDQSGRTATTASLPPASGPSDLYGVFDNPL
jgi:hypothetical protein